MRKKIIYEKCEMKINSPGYESLDRKGPTLKHNIKKKKK